MKKQQDEQNAMSRLYSRAVNAMEKEQPFLDPQLSLCKLARIVGTNRTDLSQALNSQTKMNFCRWLAIYRVNHILRQIETFPDKSLEHLYPASGFSSRTSFFRQFKEITGKSPRLHATVCQTFNTKEPDTYVNHNS